MGAGLEKYSEAGAGGRVSGNGALSGHNSFLTEGVVSGEQKFLPLLLRSCSAPAPLIHVGYALTTSRSCVAIREKKRRNYLNVRKSLAIKRALSSASSAAAAAVVVWLL